MNYIFKIIGFIILFSRTVEGAVMGIGFMIIGYLKDIIDRLEE